MFGNLARLFVSVEAQTKGFDAGMARSQARFNAFANALTARTATMAAGMSQGFGNLAAGVAGAFGINPIAGGMLALGAAAGAAVKGASDLNETLSKTDVILGDASPAVKQFADDMASRFGLVKGETLDVAAGIGGLGKSLGKLEGAELSKFTTDFTKLAADFASMDNSGIDEAGQALRVAFSGEQSDTLKKYGIILTEDTMKAYALAHGIKKTGDAFTEQQKFAIRSKMLLEGLADASGDLERTEMGFANQSRKLWGTLQNSLTSFGAALEPLTGRFVGFLNRIAGGISGLVSGYGPALTAFAETIGRGFDWIAATAAELGDGLASFAQQIADEVQSWEVYTTAVNALGAAWEWLRSTAAEVFATCGVIWRNFGLIMQEGAIRARMVVANIVEAVTWMADAAGQLLVWFGGNWVQLLADAFNAGLTIVKNFVSNVWENMKALWAFLTNPSEGLDLKWTPLLDGFEATVEKLPEIARPYFTDLQGEIDAVRDKMNEAERAHADALKKPAEAGKAADGAAKKPAGDKAEAAMKKVEAKFTGLAEFSKELQSGILGKGNEAKRTADGVQQLVAEQRGLRSDLKAGINRPARAGR